MASDAGRAGWVVAAVLGVLLVVVVAVVFVRPSPEEGEREACERLAEIQREVGLEVDLDDGC